MSADRQAVNGTRDFQEGVGNFPQEGFGDTSPASRNAALGFPETAGFRGGGSTVLWPL